jgi:hypothetical protein
VSGTQKVDFQVERPAPAKKKAEAGGELSPEAALWSGIDMDRSLEISRKDVEARMAEAAASEQADKEEGRAFHEESREANERKEKLQKLGGWRPVQARPHTAKPDPRAALMRRPATTGKGGFSQQTVKQAALSSSSYNSLSPVGPLQNRLAGEVARPERPPDAFTLLKEAKEKGVLFTEDALQDGHSEDQEDPALAEAVEECIRRCFGLRGILRIGPGKNDRGEAIIVVAVTQGFTDANLSKVPAEVNGFKTLIAIPFDLLPLRRER